MSESVEQAALRRAELVDLPAPWGSVLAAMEASERLNDSRYRHLTETRDAMYEEIAEIRDAMLALDRRIDGVIKSGRAVEDEARDGWVTLKRQVDGLAKTVAIHSERIT